MRVFQNYHKHTYYTNPIISDSIVSNEDYARRASDLGHGIISVMEHGWCGRYIEGYELEQQYSLKFVQGAELYWVKDRFEKDRSNCHIYVGAMNENGRRALNDIASEACMTGYYYQPRVDLELLTQLPPEDVVVTSACVAGWKYEDADEIMKRLANHFGSNFFLEVQYHNTDLQRELNERVLKLHYSEKIPIIMGCDSHYIVASGGSDRDEYLVSKNIHYPEEDGWCLDYPDGDEAYRRFSKQCVLSHEEILEAMDNTNIFLGVKEYECDCFNKKIKMPNIYPNLTQEEKNNKYKQIIYTAWDKEKTKIPSEQWTKYEQEIDKELTTIFDTNHADYFLFNHAMIAEGKRLGGVLTPSGRGSAISFYTNKLAGFTDVDRIAAKVHMYPERFMSATRILKTGSLADIDFNVSKQEPFVQAQINILGEGHSYPMLAYGTMKASSAWKMYAKSQSIEFETANIISEQIQKYEKALKHAEEDDRENIDAFDYVDKEFHHIYQKSIEYQGIVDSFSPHPCAYLIYTGDIRREIGLIRIKDKICCCMDGKWAEEYKFLKNDLLIVSVVSIIERAFRYAGVPMMSADELLKICTPDSKVWDVYKNGCTVGINQVEKKGTTHRVMNYQPTNISELCSFVAAIRPGFKSMYKKFEARERFSYGIKSLDDIIQTEEMPNSYILYQEMSMAVLNYAGIPMTECYEIIKNIAKKRIQKVLKYKEQFINGFTSVLRQNEHKTQSEAEKLSNQVWKILEDSSQYSFNACVSGDTYLYGDSSGNTVESYYMSECYHNAKSHDGTMGTIDNQIVRISYSGVRPLYKITTLSGAYLKCTDNHRFPTAFGDNRMLKDISRGDVLLTTEGDEIHYDLVTNIEPCGDGTTYDVEMRDPHHNFIANNGIVTSNSHSYCVSIDSLYGAYLKTFYPLAFYRAYLEVQEERKNKEKMIEARNEAENYFGIRFLPYKFGQDNRIITTDANTNSITNYLTAIKGFGYQVAVALYTASLYKHLSLIDLLAILDIYGVKSSKTIDLAKIDYFSDFGNSVEVSMIIQLFDDFNQGRRRTLDKENTPKWMLDFISDYAVGKTKQGKESKRWTFTNIFGFLNKCENHILKIGINDADFRVKFNNQNDILGYVNIQTNKIEDRKKLIVCDVRALANQKNTEPWGYAIFTQSIGSGKKGRFTIRSNIFQNTPLNKGDVIQVMDDGYYKNQKGFWYLNRYNLIA